MFKKIKLLSKFLNFIGAIENFLKGHKTEIEKIKEFLPIAEDYIAKAKDIIKKVK